MSTSRPAAIFNHLLSTLGARLATALCALMIAVLVASAPAQAAANARVQVETLTNLKADASLAQRQRTPILIAFFASYCEWCERVEQEFLRPMLLSGEYGDKVIIRKLETDSYGHITGLDGKLVQPGQFSHQYDAYFTPTLVFIDHHGKELAERMIGLTTPEMYGGYLDNAIDQALFRYRAQSADE